MEISDEQLIPASQAEVWRSLNDPEVLKDCIFGCESIEKVSDTELTFVAAIAVGPVKARFKGTLRLADLDPPNSYSMSFDTQGGTAGFGKGSAKVSLTPEGTGTRLRLYGERPNRRQAGTDRRAPDRRRCKKNGE